jgi:hypothetical protein
VRHYATPDFWESHALLPTSVRRLAHRNVSVLKRNPNHPSLHFKRIGRFYSVRVGRGYRALAPAIDDGAVWFWIESHAQYDRLIG